MTAKQQKFDLFQIWVSVTESSMKMMGSNSMGRSKRRTSSRLGGVLKEQKARLYIIRRCVVMLLCYHD
ncbi:hypothetical protein L2E82_13896 [Cichorium intybus]|uniref:Uncharacterized protein n=1 Tax=Cichorium intybus TaxID=13427 RepID=A0ACB9EXW4_CICIN|nr:hypothetical protein L2E82_13896 [Cichorium intybus]